MLIQEFKHKLTSRLQDWLNFGVKLPTSISALTKQYLSIYKQMQIIDRIRDRTKPQASQTTSASVFLRQVAHLYQRSVTNTRTNTLFLCFSSSIMGTMILMPQYWDKKQAHLMKEGRCFSCKEKGYTTYNYLKKGKITAISEGVSKDSDSQKKE